MKIGKERLYNDAFSDRNDVILWEVLEVSNKQKLKIKFISKKSPHRQGIRIAIDDGEGGIEVNGHTNKGIQLWEDTAPKEVICNCDSENGMVSIYNIYDKGNGEQSQSHTSGMLLEKKGNELVYKCNDFGFETNFDKLVFSIEKLE